MINRDDAYFSTKRKPGVVFLVPATCPFHPDSRASSSVAKAYRLNGTLCPQRIGAYLCGDSTGSSKDIECCTLSKKDIATLSTDFSHKYSFAISGFDIDFGAFRKLPMDSAMERREDFYIQYEISRGIWMEAPSKNGTPARIPLDFPYKSAFSFDSARIHVRYEWNFSVQ